MSRLDVKFTLVALGNSNYRTGAPFLNVQVDSLSGVCSLGA